MTTVTSLKPIANEFLQMFGQLIGVRITQYIQKHHKGSVSNFVNNFIIFVDDVYDFDKDGLRESASAKASFEHNINIKFASLEIDGIMLDDDMQVVYFLSTYPTFLDDDYDGDYLGLSLTGTDIQLPYKHMVTILNDTPDKKFEDLISLLKQELTFGTIKGS